MSVPAVAKRVNLQLEICDYIPDVKIIKPKVFPDDRGFFSETYNKKEWSEIINFRESFEQDNHSFSRYGVLRGLHAQEGMGKLVSVVQGEIFDVAVDIRKNSSTFGKWFGAILNSENKNALWVPDGFLHGFQCLSLDGAHVTYKCTSTYDPAIEFGVNPFDETIAVKWPIMDKNKIIVSERDTQHKNLRDLFPVHNTFVD